MEVLKLFFYLFGIILLVRNLTIVFYTKNHLKRADKGKELKEILKEKKFEDFNSEEMRYVFSVYFALASLAWVFIGFFTFNWLIFLCLIIIFMIYNQIRLFAERKGFKLLRLYSVKITSIITILAITFCIINAYHLKIDLFHLL